jgi:hypothetical protein
MHVWLRWTRETMATHSEGSMKTVRPVLILAVALVGTLAFGGAPTGTVDRRTDLSPETSPVAASRATARARCVFSNASYSGQCVETPEVASDSTPAAACNGILGCLNNAMCAKNYCQSTNVRTGWRLESAEYESEER